MDERLVLVKSVVIALVIALASSAHAAMTVPGDLKPPVEDGIWLRPDASGPAEPTIGFKQGLRIGLWPAADGPRGVIRIYAPYVFPGQKRPLINYIAIEPIVDGRRSLSEIEHSALDDRAASGFGSRMRSTPRRSPRSPGPVLRARPERSAWASGRCARSAS